MKPKASNRPSIISLFCKLQTILYSNFDSGWDGLRLRWRLQLKLVSPSSNYLQLTPQAYEMAIINLEFWALFDFWLAPMCRWRTGTRTREPGDLRLVGLGETPTFWSAFSYSKYRLGGRTRRDGIVRCVSLGQLVPVCSHGSQPYRTAFKKNIPDASLLKNCMI